MSPRPSHGFALLVLCVSCTARMYAQDAPPTPVRESLVVLGNPAPVSEGEAARTVTALDAQQYPLAYQTVEEYLRTDAAVDIEQRAPGVMSDISVRGASFEQTLVLLRGMRMDDAETSHFNLDLPVPLEAIGDIDVLHGAGSTLYGSDAIGGVVAVDTWKPQHDTVRTRAGGGSFGENEQALLIAALGRQWAGTVAGSRDFSSGFISDRDYRSEQASAESWLTTKLGTSNVLLAGDDRAFGAAQFYGNYPSWERTKGWFATLEQPLAAHTDAAAAFRRHSDIYVLERDDPSLYKNQHVDWGYEGSVRDQRAPFKDVTLLTGLEVLTDQIKSTNLGDHGRNRGAGYGDLEWRVPGRGSISAGFREEIYSGGRAVSSPTASATLWLPHSVKLRSSIGYGFRIPTYLDLYYSDPTTLGNAGLKPESAWNYEGGVDWYATTRVAATLTGFYSRQKNTIDYTRVSSADPWQASNLPGLHFAGVEAALDWHARPTQAIKLSWALLAGAQSALHGLQSEYVFNYPVNNGRAEWTWDVSRQAVLQTRVAVVERYQQSPYAVWDESLVRERGRVRPYLQLRNLSNTGYDEVIGVRMPGRALVGGLQVVLTRDK
ncbi:TonB-dependent siderophore receptor [Acidipila sp. EB88]|uniref:TonB-dependent receptor plug domain-containing protein n=1 Tax=Acidipila sp. EB88 TaxID=2305226 RepID=UPI000F5EB85F|nr:TonB-dependent receptor [Acidipila sp. EB88]RRA49371.1 TonB-dependent receptor [Acidipila sp. EB88]